MKNQNKLVVFLDYFDLSFIIFNIIIACLN